jgi:3-oxoacyl-[acyl-carrier protein] reductase
VSVLKGQLAVVTGSGSGIGKAIAEELCQQGAHVFIADIDKEKATEAASQLNEKGFAATAYKLDVANSAEVAAFFKSIEDNYGKLDILVNNAGFAASALVTNMSDNEWFTMINVHASGSFFCLREASKIMKKNRYGRIVNMSSLAAEGGLSGHAHYSAAKYAIVGLTEVAAKELGPFHITVNAIKPGLIRTPLGEQGLLAKVGERLRNATPVKRIGETKDVARAVSFLVHPESDFLTGISIIVDGGLNLMDEQDVVALESFENL